MPLYLNINVDQMLEPEIWDTVSGILKVNVPIIEKIALTVEITEGRLKREPR